MVRSPKYASCTFLCHLGGEYLTVDVSVRYRRSVDRVTLQYVTRASDIFWRFLTGKRGQDNRFKIVVRRHLAVSAGLTVMSICHGWWPLLTWLSAVMAMATLRSWRYVATWTFRRQVLAPTMSVLDPVVRKLSPSGQGITKLTIPRDFRDNADREIVVHLPMDWTPGKDDKARLGALLAERLSVDTLSAAWTLSGRKPRAVFGQPPKPPDKVTFADMVAAANVAKPDAVVMGQGTRGQVATFDLAIESPHMLMGAGSGAGKSELLAWMVGQFMRRGYGVLVLDAKFTSHMWLRCIPGVSYSAESEELHDGLLWLDGELLRRARFVSSGGDPASSIPLVVVAEEMNGATNRLRTYWKDELGGKGMSPALTALANLSAMGRELRIHILMAGQSMTAKAAGGPESRESFGARALARATTNQWKMLAPQIKPAPVKRMAPGRWHLVVGDTLKEFQAPFVDIKGEQARLIEWATGLAPVVDVPSMMSDDVTVRNPRTPTSEAASSSPGISLRRYANERGVDFLSLMNWRVRRSDFPVEVGQGANNTKLYDQDHLNAFVAARLREPASPEVR